MKPLGRIFDFYLEASIHVALAVFSLLKVTAFFLNIVVDEHLLYFAFFGTIACYNFVKYGVEAEKYVMMANRYHAYILFASFIAMGMALYHGYFLTVEVWIGIVVLIGLTALYALPVLPKAKNFRSLGGFKIFIVALVWSGVTVLLPAITADLIISWDVSIALVQRFLLVLVLMIPFEIRDLKYDAPELRTLPQRYGVGKTKIIGVLLVAVFFSITFLKDEITFWEGMARAILFLILGISLWVTKRDQPKYFASFCVEGIPIFWWGLVCGLGVWT